MDVNTEEVVSEAPRSTRNKPRTEEIAKDLAVLTKRFNKLVYALATSKKVKGI